jgi:hypothetical protein
LISIRGFDRVDFFNSAFVSSTFEFGSEPDSDQIADGTVADQIAWKAKNVYVIVPATHLGHDFVRARCRSHSAKFVRNNGHAESVPANQYSTFCASVSNFFGDRNCIVWIIDGLVVVSAEVFYLVTISRQQSDKFAFDLKSSMITSNGDSHCYCPVISNESNPRR